MNCLITITGISETGDADSVETKSLGMVHSVKTEAGSGYRLDYRTSEDGLGTKHTITLCDDFAEIKRSGGIRTVIKVVPGEDHDCLYETSAGVLAFTVRGKASAVWEENGKVSARLSYSLMSGQDILSNNEILITAEPLG